MAGARDEKLYIGPEIVHLHITNRCNLRCRYCWHHSPGNPELAHPAQDLPFRKFCAILKDCRTLKVNNLYISGEGEPTLHPRFAQMMDLAEQYPLAVTVFSNATFPSSLLPALLKADHLVVDLSAPDAADYQIIHGADHFNRVVNNIKALSQMRKDLGKHLSITGRCVMNRINQPRLHEISGLMRSIGVDSIELVPMQPTPFNRDIAIKPKDPLPHGPKKGPECNRCFNGWFYLSARLNGQMSYCCRVPQINTGHLYRSSLKTAWGSKKFMALRVLGKTSQINKKFKECAECHYKRQNIAVLLELARMKRITPRKSP